MTATRQSGNASDGGGDARLPWVLRLRHGAEWAGLSAVLALFRLLPVTTAARLMGKAWRMLAPFNKRHRRALDNLERALPDLSPEQREMLTATASAVVCRHGRPIETALDEVVSTLRLKTQA